MRKLTLVTAMLLLSTGAFAGGPRGLSMPQPAVQQPAVQPAAEQQRPVHRAEVTILPGPAEQPAVTSPPPSMEDKLKAAGELRPDGSPAQQSRTQIQQLQPQVQPQAQAPVQPAPVPTRVSKVAPTPELVVTPEPTKSVAQEPVRKRTAHAHAYEPARKPVKQRVARRGESNERKARRIASYFGVYW